MRSNFESSLDIVGGKVHAEGKLDWGPGEEESLVSVSISQKQHKVAGMATSPRPFEKDKPDKKWTLVIEPGYYDTSFEDGPADAVGIVCAMSDTKVNVFFWAQEVELKLKP